MLAGMQQTGTDVGGSQFVSNLKLEAHGASLLHNTFQVDIGVQKTFRTGGVSYEAKFDYFNLLNASTITRERSTNFDPSSYAVPRTVLHGRLPRLSVPVRW